MVGGNPQHHAYGFANWNHIAFQEYLSTGAKGRFEGFLGALWSASFAVVGPEYISMVSAEAKRPRIYIKTAFKTIYWRFGLFFFGSALAVGIILACDNETLVNVQLGDGGSSDAGASPYVIAMQAMGVEVLPHIVNALMLTSIFSAGNTYTYCATRSLYGLALEGRAPAFLRKCNSRGVPIYCFMIVMCFPFLSFLQVGKGSAVAVTWFVDLITAGGIIDYIGMSITFIFYHRACIAQGLDRKSLPYYGRFQPYGAYIAIVIQTLIILFYGYTAFAHPIKAENFFKNYTMQCLAPILFFGWKFLKGTKLKKAHEVDLVWERPAIDAYESRFVEPPVGFWTEMMALFGYKKSKVRQIEG